MATRKLSILVAGGYDPQDPRTLTRPVEEIREFVRELGREIVRGVAPVAADDQRMPQLDQAAPEQFGSGVEPRLVLEAPFPLVRLSPTADDCDTHGDLADLMHLMPRPALERALESVMRVRGNS